MAKRLYVKVNFSNHVTDGKVHTITATHGNLSETASARTLGAAMNKARQALREQVIVAESKPEVIEPTATPTQLNPQDLFGLLAQFLVSQGVSAAQVQAPVSVPATPAPAPATASKKLVGPNCEAWFRARLEAVRVVNPQQKEANKARKGSFGPGRYKFEIDQLMAAKGCEPVYEGRTRAEINKINAMTKKAFTKLRAEEKAKAA